MNYLKKHNGLILAGILLIICFLLYFTNMGSYPFIDTDETKFVSIAKEMLNNNDWVNIKLNGENLFEMPPFVFWLINSFCIMFGKISNEAVRFPISYCSIFGILALFLVLKQILTKTYSLIVSFILLTSLGFVVFARLATNDILFTVFTMVIILSTYLVIFSKNEKKTTFCWFCIYLFTAINTLCAGLLGFLLPLFAILTMHIFSGNLKEIIKPKNILPGLVIFLLLVLPWPIIMTYKYGLVFIKDNLQAYNLFNYISIKNMLITIGIFILGFSPWAFSFLWILGQKLKDTVMSVFSYFKDNSQEKLKEKWKKLSKVDKFLSLNTIVFFTALIFALLYGAKYTYLILFLIFPAACLSGHYWYEYIIKKEHDKSIFFATMIPNLIFIICSLIGIFGHNILNTWIFQGLSHLLIPLIIIFFVIPVISIFAVLLKGRIVPFTANIILMISLSFVITPTIFNFISLNSGENDLINFANIANKEKVELAAYIPSKKYSLVYYYDKPVVFHKNNDIKWLKEYINTNKQAYIVVEIKDMWDIEENKIIYTLLDTGKRYCLIKYMDPELLKKEDTEEPQIILY